MLAPSLGIMNEEQYKMRILQLEQENETLKEKIKARSEKIGALWKKDKNGTKFYTGVLELPGQDTINIVVFHNGYKTSDKHPDYVIYVSRPKEQKEESDPARDDIGYQEHINQEAPKEEQEEIKPEDIPF